MIQYKPTKKLFYGKWLYKVSYNIDGCSYIRHKSFDGLERSIDQLMPNSTYNRKILGSKEELIRLTSNLKAIPRESYDIRVETNIIDVYTNDEAFFNSLILLLPGRIRYAQKPSTISEQQLTDKRTILVKKYPQDRFTMRVYLKPHKMELSDKGPYIAWLKEINGVSISDAVQQWFITTHWNWDRRYILVDNEKTLLFLKLKNSSVIGTVYNLVLQD